MTKKISFKFVNLAIKSASQKYTIPNVVVEMIQCLNSLFIDDRIRAIAARSGVVWAKKNTLVLIRTTFRITGKRAGNTSTRADSRTFNGDASAIAGEEGGILVLGADEVGATDRRAIFLNGPLATARFEISGWLAFVTILRAFGTVGEL